MLKAQYATSTRFNRDTMTVIVAAHLDGSKPIDSITRISYNYETIVRIAYADTTSAFFYSHHSDGNAVTFIRLAFLNYGQIDHPTPVDYDAVYHTIPQSRHEAQSAKSFKRNRDYLFSLAANTYFE